ncbi:MAG: TolC family protein [bacterium]|nr:TolC family protein [bacterium]
MNNTTITREAAGPLLNRLYRRLTPIGKLLLMFSILFSGAALSIAQPVSTPGNLQETASLANYLQIAAQNNPGLKAAFNRWKAALEKIPQVRALPDPTFNFSYFIREVETRVGPQKGKIGVKQMFPWFGKLKLKGNAAMEAANAEQQRYENAKLVLFYNVKKIYYQYYFVNRSISLLKKNIQLLHSLEGVLMAKYRAGTAPYSILLKIQVELEKLKDRLASKKDLLGPVQAQLNAALNRDISQQLPVPKQIPYEMSSLNQSLLANVLKTNNPRLKALDHMVEMGQTQIKLAKKNYSPDFSLGLTYVVTAQTPMTGVSGSGKDPIAASLSLRIPIWSKKNKAAVNAAAAGFRAAQNNRLEKENNLLAQLKMVYFSYKDALRKMKLYKESLLPRAEQTLEVTRSAFEAGNNDFMDFIDSQRNLLAFQLEYEGALTRQAQRLAELQMLVGKENLGDIK